MQRLSYAESRLIGAGVMTVTSTDNNGSPWKCDCTCYNPEQVKFIDESDDSLIWLVASKTYHAVWGTISSYWK